MIIENREHRSIMVGDHKTRAVESLGLVNKHVTTLVVSIIGYDNPIWEERRGEKHLRAYKQQNKRQEGESKNTSQMSQ